MNRRNNEVDKSRIEEGASFIYIYMYKETKAETSLSFDCLPVPVQGTNNRAVN